MEAASMTLELINPAGLSAPANDSQLAVATGSRRRDQQAVPVVSGADAKRSATAERQLDVQRLAARLVHISPGRQPRLQVADLPVAALQLLLEASHLAASRAKLIQDLLVAVR